jgi:two-component system phosphate regulon sensor histidine kinase PhoR
MSIAWGVAVLLLAVIIIQFISCRHKHSQLQAAITETARSAVRLDLIKKELSDVKTRRGKLLSASTEALIIVEKDYTVSSDNKMARRMFGKKPGKDATLMSWIRQYQLQELAERTMKDEKMPPVYFPYQDRYMEAHARAIKYNREIVAVALAIHDITNLQHLTRMRRDFVANISHELRTPVTSIQLLAETLCKGAISDKKMAPKLVKKITAEADTLSQLAQELLDLSLIESGQMPLKLGIFPLLDIVNQQVERLHPQASRKNLEVIINITPNIYVLIDEVMMGRVIGNLLHNAIKFTEIGTITVTADPATIVTNKQNEAWITVSVVDTGIGIPLPDIKRIFERFYKVDQARARKKSGTGLGLAIARHVLDGHGGKIWVDSDGVSGTAVYFTLPLEHPPAETE